MKPLLLNVASRPFLNNRVVGTAIGVAGAALILATVWNLSVYLGYGGSYRQLSLEERQDRAKFATFFNDERTLMKEVQARDFRGAWDRGRLAGDLISRWSFSWTLLFNRLEQVMPVDVMMTAIRPTFGPQGIVVRVEGVAKSQPALINFEEALLQRSAFRRIYPLSERRLNPSRPEISFVVNFDYVPGQEVAPVVTTAAAGSSTDAPAEAPAPAAAAAASPTPAMTPPVATAANVAPATTEPTRPAATPPALVMTAGTVARDGQVRTPELLARLLVAPGGVYESPEAQHQREAQARQDRRGRKGSKPASTAPGAATPPASAASPTPGTSPAGTTTSRGTPSSPRASATSAAASPRVAMPKGEGLPRGTVGPAAARPATERLRPAVPATRLDVPLVFEARPVGDIYDALARAHHVRFEVDGGVDRNARVTVNLQGTILPDAIRMVARVAGHRVVRQGEGAYRVALATGGEPMGDRPVGEESLAAPVEDR